MKFLKKLIVWRFEFLDLSHLLEKYYVLSWPRPEDNGWMDGVVHPLIKPVVHHFVKPSHLMTVSYHPHLHNPPLSIYHHRKAKTEVLTSYMSIILFIVVVVYYEKDFKIMKWLVIKKCMSMYLHTKLLWGISQLKGHLGRVYMNPALLYVTTWSNLLTSRERNVLLLK